MTLLIILPRLSFLDVTDNLLVLALLVHLARVLGRGGRRSFCGCRLLLSGLALIVLLILLGLEAELGHGRKRERLGLTLAMNPRFHLGVVILIHVAELLLGILLLSLLIVLSLGGGRVILMISLSSVDRRGSGRLVVVLLIERRVVLKLGRRLVLLEALLMLLLLTHLLVVALCLSHNLLMASSALLHLFYAHLLLVSCSSGGSFSCRSRRFVVRFVRLRAELLLLVHVLLLLITMLGLFSMFTLLLLNGPEAIVVVVRLAPLALKLIVLIVHERHIPLFQLLASLFVLVGFLHLSQLGLLDTLNVREVFLIEGVHLVVLLIFLAPRHDLILVLIHLVLDLLSQILL